MEIATGLSFFTQRMLNDGAEAVLSSLDEPLLVWTVRGMELDSSVKTRSEVIGQESARGEPVVFKLSKNPDRPTPFAMRVTLGRTANNDILVAHPSVSRFHAYFQKDPRDATWALIDAESKNGTFIGDQKLVPTRPTSLPDGSLIRFGEAEIRYFSPLSFVQYLKVVMAATH